MKWAILTLISIFICICCAQMLEWDHSGNLIAHSYSVWGDWSAHFTFISNLLNRGTQWISGDNPVFFGMPFQYPFLSHLFTAFFSLVTQIDAIHSTYLISLGLLFTLPFVLFHFFKSTELTNRQSILGVILFLFLGGLQAFDSTLNVNEPLTNQFKSGSVFTQIVLFELFPQRAFLFGMILLLGGLIFVRKKIQKAQFTKKHFILFSVYFAFLSWMHLHSWIVMGLLLLVYFIFNIKKENSKNILYFGSCTLLISIPLIYFLIFRTNGEQITWDKWYPGWAQNPKANLDGAQEMSFIRFWIYNTGLLLPLAIVGKWITWNKNKSISENPTFILGTVGSILFLVAILFNIQPYFYDNLKIFTYVFLLLTPFAAIAMDALFTKKAWIPIALILISIQSYTSFQDYLFFKDQRQTTPFLSKEEFDLAEKFKTLRRSADSLVMITPKHNHWITTLAGNPVLMGYPGWLWSWGINYSPREREINEALAGGPHATEIISKYPIEYIAVNDQERVGNFPVSINFLRSQYPILMESGNWHVFKVK
jgi:hypothetical protein